MPVTRLLNSAIDGVARTMDETRAEIARYAGSDLLCYRAEEPETLAERQRLAFDPVLDWAARSARRAASRSRRASMHVAQPPEALAAVRAALDAVDDPVALAALSVDHDPDRLGAAGACGRRAGALAPTRRGASAHVDEDFQNEHWGVDEEAMARRAARWREMEAAASRAGGDGRACSRRSLSAAARSATAPTGSAPWAAARSAAAPSFT